MAAVAVNWIAHRPGAASVIVGGTRRSQLDANLDALSFAIPPEHSAGLEAASRPDRVFPYSFFESEIQGMIHGGAYVGSKPPAYSPEVVIDGTGAGVE